MDTNRRDALRLLTFGLGAGALTTRSFAQDAPPAIGAERLREGLTMVTGAGGNIVVCSGADGGLLVDSGLADQALRTAAKIAESAPYVALLVNTHWHFDHAGGNARFGGGGARIVASANCRRRLGSEQVIEAFGRELPASPKEALPTVTIESETALHANGQTVRLVPVPPAHTDGDVIVCFEEANLLHMGDLFFHGMFPFIDYSSGGNIPGMVAAAEKAIALVDADTVIVPGHGPVATPDDLKGYHAFLETMSGRLASCKERGLDAEAVVAEKPAQDYVAAMGGGFLDVDSFVKIAYESLLRSP